MIRRVGVIGLRIISGGYVAARSGQLSLMVGAEPVALERAEPVFRTFASVLGTQAALIADSGFATGHDNPAL
jgi:hypothetical protein